MLRQQHRIDKHQSSREYSLPELHCLDAEPCPVPPGLFEDSSSSHRVHWGHRDSRNFQVEERGGAELSEVKRNAKFLKYILATERQEPLVYANPFCHAETFLAAGPFLFFLLPLTAATIPPTTAVRPSPAAHSLPCPSPFLLLAFVATSHCREGKYVNLGISRFGKKLKGQI